MTHPSGSGTAAQIRLLLTLDRRRFASVVTRSTPGSMIALLLPPLVLGSALWTLGRTGLPASAGATGGLTLSLLVAGSAAFVSYGVLFSTHDQGFLRISGVDGSALYTERGLRLLLTAVIMAGGLAFPFLAGGANPGRPFAIGLVGASIAAGIAILTYAWAAQSLASNKRNGLLSAGLGQFDPGLAKAAPLVYAPLLPFVCGALAGALAGAKEGAPWIYAAVAVVFATSCPFLGGRVFGSVAPTFIARVGEMSYTPPRDETGEAFRPGRGLSALLPRRAAAVWVRDATVAGRRFAWAARTTWPVAAVSMIALARWADSPATQGWVLAAVGLALLVQSAAVIAVGLLEHEGRRWLDRSLGINWFNRFLGRWAWAWGTSLWLLVPVGLAWSWWSGAGPAWAWPAAGALTAAASTTVSLLNADRK